MRLKSARLRQPPGRLDQLRSVVGHEPGIDVAPVRARGFDHPTQGSYAVAAGVAQVPRLDPRVSVMWRSRRFQDST
jgi:2-methylcitrate dehydratase PrpD